MNHTIFGVIGPVFLNHVPTSHPKNVFRFVDTYTHT